MEKKKHITALVLPDVSKVFDSIDHARLLHKLSNVGASPSTVNCSRATYLVATNTGELAPHTRKLCQSSMAFLKERFYHHCYSVFI